MSWGKGANINGSTLSEFHPGKSGNAAPSGDCQFNADMTTGIQSVGSGFNMSGSSLGAWQPGPSGAENNTGSCQPGVSGAAGTWTGDVTNANDNPGSVVSPNAGPNGGTPNP